MRRPRVPAAGGRVLGLCGRLPQQHRGDRGVAADDLEQRASRRARCAATAFPAGERARVEPEASSKGGLAEAGSVTDGRDICCGHAVPLTAHLGVTTYAVDVFIVIDVGRGRSARRFSAGLRRQIGRSTYTGRSARQQ